LSILDLFNGRHKTNLIEFKNVIKKLGLTPREIEKLYEALTPGGPNEYTGEIDLTILAKKIERIE
jgi:23S rRNA-/tRNA-specific pseudouridylate synthase